MFSKKFGEARKPAEKSEKGRTAQREKTKTLSSFFKQMQSLSTRFCFAVGEAVITLFSQIFRRLGRWLRSVPAGMAHVCRRIFSGVGRFFLRRGRTILNYALPVAGLFLFLGVTQHFMGLSFGLAVEYRGKTIGYVQDEEVVYSAQQMLREQIVYGAGQEEIAIEPTWTVTLVEKDRLSDADDVCSQLIEASRQVIEPAFGLTVKGEFLGAVTDGEALTRTLDGLLEAYRAAYDFESVSFVDEVEVKEGLYPVDDILPVQELTALVTSEVSAQISYTVKAGDAPYTVAREFGITLEELYANNPIIDNGNRFLPGDVLLIAGAEPFLSIQGTRTEIHTEAIPYPVEKVSTSSLYQGQTQIKKAGVKGEQEVTYSVTYRNDTVIEKTALSTTVIREPVTQVLWVGTKKVPQSVSTITPSTGNGKIGDLTFLWPVDGGYYSRGWASYHKAIDIAAPLNTPLRAAADGVVVSAFTSGWNTGYGRYVKIDHGNGVCTLYAHCNVLKVTVGQQVKQGDLIALVGDTGNSSGTHVHFEIQVNGNRMDPEPYIGRYCNR